MYERGSEGLRHGCFAALSDMGSSFGVSRNISFDEDVSGLCGLTRSDIQAALGVCGLNSEAYHRHLLTMTEHFNGYNFCDEKKVEIVYDTDTCLSYLQVGINFLLRDALRISLSLSIAPY
jgi:hypothetical protein